LTEFGAISHEKPEARPVNSLNTFYSLAENASLIFVLVVVYGFAWNSFLARYLDLAMGTLLGIAALIAMQLPVHIAPGVTIDARTILVAIAGYYFGWKGGLAAFSLAASYRLALGGVGTIAGIVALGAVATLGAVWQRRRWYPLMSYGSLLLFGCAVAVTSLVTGLMFLPTEIAWTIISGIYIPVMTVYPIGVLLYGKLLGSEYLRQQTQKALLESEARYRTAFQTSPDAINITRLSDGLFLEVNDGFTKLMDWSREETLGRTSIEINIWRKTWDRDRLVDSLQRHGYCNNLEADFVTKNGRVMTCLMSAHTMELNGQTCILSVTRDITARKEAEARINNLAFFDPLTDLPNRRLLLDRLKHAIASSARNESYGALLFIDLDNFKTLNDTLGHDKGDLLLQQAATRLVHCVREGDTVARLGGDEFVVLLESLSADAQEAAGGAESVGEKILLALNEPYQLAGFTGHSSPSIGVTLFADHQGSMDELLKRADLAMYQAKEAGRNTLRFFEPEMQAAVTTRAALELDLRKAVQHSEFVLHYQPQVDLRGHITGVEALVRWQNQQRGLVSPMMFIPLAESTGLILQIGRWVLVTACAQLGAWAEQPKMSALSIAVNVSARQFYQQDFVEQVLSNLEQTGANPKRLKLELTETLLVSNIEDVIAKMHKLKAIGVGFSLDDFGTGYSSLSYLKRLPLDQLKIDQSFVRDVLTDPNDAAIARTVIALGQSMQLAVIAEGVETQGQRDFLESCGCHAYQGYFFSRPLPLEHFERYLATRALESA
jgi:diguanylate cyclase (GGDEF)-like protein/PAS domain S-box-containing protein